MEKWQELFKIESESKTRLLYVNLSRLQALRAFEKVEDQLLMGQPHLKRTSLIEDQVPKRIGQRLSSDSFSSSGFGSAMSQQSNPETPSCSCIQMPTLYSPISLFDPHTKNVLLLRDTAQGGFGFSISEREDAGIFVNAVKAGGIAEQMGVCPKDRIIQVYQFGNLNLNLLRSTTSARSE